jgi:hypothetical protein
VEDDATGEELEVVWEIEPGAQVIERARLPALQAPFRSAHFPRLIVSIDWLKGELGMRLLREVPPHPQIPRRYDVLIVDEVHNCAPAGAGGRGHAAQEAPVLLPRRLPAHAGGPSGDPAPRRPRAAASHPARSPPSRQRSIAATPSPPTGSSLPQSRCW